jgi:hypothetical protein
MTTVSARCRTRSRMALVRPASLLKSIRPTGDLLVGAAETG